MSENFKYDPERLLLHTVKELSENLAALSSLQLEARDYKFIHPR